MDLMFKRIIDGTTPTEQYLSIITYQLFPFTPARKEELKIALNDVKDSIREEHLTPFTRAALFCGDPDLCTILLDFNCISDDGNAYSVKSHIHRGRPTIYKDMLEILRNFDFADKLIDCFMTLILSYKNDVRFHWNQDSADFKESLVVYSKRTWDQVKLNTVLTIL
jgi:hypothetical protein